MSGRSDSRGASGRSPVGRFRSISCSSAEAAPTREPPISARWCPRFPVNRLTEATDRLLNLYREQKQDGEELGAFFRRIPPATATAALNDLAQLLPTEVTDADLVDLGESHTFNPEVMDGECSA